MAAPVCCRACIRPEDILKAAWHVQHSLAGKLPFVHRDFPKLPLFWCQSGCLTAFASFPAKTIPVNIRGTPPVCRESCSADELRERGYPWQIPPKSQISWNGKRSSAPPARRPLPSRSGPSPVARTSRRSRSWSAASQSARLCARLPAPGPGVSPGLLYFYGFLRLNPKNLNFWQFLYALTRSPRYTLACKLVIKASTPRKSICTVPPRRHYRSRLVRWPFFSL